MNYDNRVFQTVFFRKCSFLVRRLTTLCFRYYTSRQPDFCGDLGAACSEWHRFIITLNYVGLKNRSLLQAHMLYHPCWLYWLPMWVLFQHSIQKGLIAILFVVVRVTRITVLYLFFFI